MSTIEQADREHWFGAVEAMFGIPMSRFEGLNVVRLNTKSVAVISDDIDLDREDILSAGITLFATKMAIPKLSTAAAMAFGDAATRMVMDVSREEADAYLHRESFWPDADTASRCDGQGYVMVRFEGVPLGLGFFRTENVDRPVVQSHFPKAWSLRDGASAFGEESV